MVAANRSSVFLSITRGLYTFDERRPLERPMAHAHGFVDGSVLELIVNERAAVTHRFYPDAPTGANLRIMSPSDATITAYQVRPISPNRLTT